MRQLLTQEHSMTANLRTICDVLNSTSNRSLAINGIGHKNIRPLPSLPLLPPQPLSSPNRLKRLTNTDSVYTMCQTPDGPKFQCAMCARIFNLKCTLLRHVRHQHQGRFVPHPCKTCGQVFKRTDHLKVHMKKIHNISVTSSSHHSQPVTLIAKPSPTVN